MPNGRFDQRGNVIELLSLNKDPHGLANGRGGFPKVGKEIVPNLVRVAGRLPDRFGVGFCIRRSGAVSYRLFF
jgi:hypothetical protein